MMKFRENEDAVSPVIGVILMVAITVILAAIIAGFVFGMTSDMPDTTKNVAIGVKGAADGHMTITVQGGTDLPRLAYLKVTVEKMGSETSDKVLYTKGTENKIAEGSDGITSAGKFTVGSVWKSDASVLTPGTSRNVIVVGVFNDGTEQILTDTYL